MPRVSVLGHRLAAGTGSLLYSIGDLFNAPTGWGALGRIVGAGAGLLFVGALLMRAPALVYGVPVVWVVAAWRVSDSSTTPPPGEDRPSCSECAGHELVSVTPLEGQKGMLIYKTAPADRPNHIHIHIRHTQET